MWCKREGGRKGGKRFVWRGGRGEEISMGVDIAADVG